MDKRLKTFFFSLLVALSSQAQIGYQVSLLNSATGEPRANETVSVTVTITNSQNEQIYSGTQSATTNDFGVLSLQVGNANTFKDVDWSKLPLFISATVDGVMVGKSQILNVPVAEVAKQIVSVPLDSICKTWTAIKNSNSSGTLTLSLDGKWYFTWKRSSEVSNMSGVYFVSGSTIELVIINDEYDHLMHAVYYNGKLYMDDLLWQ